MIGYLKSPAPVLFLFIILLQALPAVCSQDFDKAAKRIKIDTSLTLKDAELTRQLVQKSKKDLKSDLDRIKKKIHQEQKVLDDLKARLNELSRHEKSVMEELDSSHREVQGVQDRVRNALKDAVSLINENPITAQFPDRSTMVQEMADSRTFFGFQDIQALVNLYFHELEAQKLVTRYAGEFTDIDGRMNQGQILRAGPFAAYVKTDTGVGFLKPGPGGKTLSALPGEPSFFVRKRIEKFYNGTGEILPIDPFGQAISVSLARKTDLRALMDKGGFLMWPILILAGAALCLILERAAVLLFTRANTDAIMKNIQGAAGIGDFEACKQICKQHKRVPACIMLEGAMKHAGATQDVLEGALQEAVLRQMPRLERFLPTLAMLAALAPLLGLLGTVTGMINVFRVITMVGTGDPQAMSGGISEALLTTQLGLAVAIPIMVAHHFFERRVDRIVNDMEEKGTAFAVILMGNNSLAPEKEANG